MKTSRFMTWTALAGSVYAGCGGATPEAATGQQADGGGDAQVAAIAKEAPHAPQDHPPLHPELPQVRSLDDAKQHAGERVEIHGTYSVAQTRMRQLPVMIQLADGTELLRAEDMVSEENHLHGRAVVIVGTVELASATAKSGGSSLPVFYSKLPKLTVETITAFPDS